MVGHPLEKPRHAERPDTGRVRYQFDTKPPSSQYKSRHSVRAGGQKSRNGGAPFEEPKYAERLGTEKVYPQHGSSLLYLKRKDMALCIHDVKPDVEVCA